MRILFSLRIWERGNAMVRKRIFAVLFLSFWLVSFPLWADTVYLNDGRILKGMVVDRGNRIEVRLSHGSVWILKRDVIRVELDDTLPGKVGGEGWLVIFKNGRRFEAQEVRYSANGKYVLITRRRGKSSYTISFEKGEIERIFSPQERAKWRRKGPVSSLSISKEFRKKIEAAIRRLYTDNFKEVLRARSELIGYGIFAVPYLRYALRKLGRWIRREEELLEVAGVYHRGGGIFFFHLLYPQLVRHRRVWRILREVESIHRIKKLITPAIEREVRNVYARLASEDAGIRLEALKEIVLYTPKDAPALLVHFLEKEEETPQIRAFCIYQLGVLNKNDYLLRLYSRSSGQIKLAAAIALGDNGIYVGIPTLIDALQMNSLAIRKLAISKLKAYTDGEFFDYFADDPVERRDKAIRAWRRWWKREGEKFLQASLISTLQRGKITKEAKRKGLELWKKGKRAWQRALYSTDRKDREYFLARAENYFVQALKHYPTFVSARLNLAILLYRDLQDYEEALKQLDIILKLYRKEAGDLGQKQAYYHMGNLYQLRRMWEEAIFRYKQALSIDPNFIDALIALGDTYHLEVVYSSEKMKSEEMRENFQNALEFYKKAIEAMKLQDRRLMRARLPEDENRILYRDAVLKVSFKDYTRSTRELRGKIYFKIARTYFAMKKKPLGIYYLKAALKWDKGNPKYKAVLRLFQ